MRSFAADSIATPTFSPAPGAYASGQRITLTSATTNAIIYYTTNNDEPTTSSLIYTEPITLSAAMTVKALAVVPDIGYSTVASAVYTIKAETPASPTFEPRAGAYASGQKISISSVTSGAVIRYTLDGTTPTPTSSPIYSEPITITSDTTIRAIAVLSGNSVSTESMAAYTVNRTMETVDITFTPEPGTFANSQSVTIGSSPSGAVIHYTLDGTDPTSTSFLTSQPITIDSSTVIKAVVAFSDGTFSSPETAEYVINPVAAPAFSPVPGAYESGQKITLTSTTNNAVIYYTTNNNEPTTSSHVYSEPITLSAAMTVKALAIVSGYGQSRTVSAAYTIKAPAVSSGGGDSTNISTPIAAAPIFTPAAGAYLSGQKISIKSATSNAVIRYTLDGTNVTTSSHVYSEPITLSAAMTVKAAAFASGYKESETASAAYTIKTEAVSNADTAITTQSVSDTPPAAEAPKEALKVGESDPTPTPTPAPTTKTGTSTDSGATAQTANTAPAPSGSNDTAAAPADPPAAEENKASLSDAIATLGGEALEIVNQACSDVNADNLKECFNTYYEKIADNVTCQDTSLSKEDCQALLRKKFLSTLIVLENKYDKIKESTQKIIGENYTSGDLEGYIDREAKVSDTTVPFQSKEVNVKVLQAVGTMILDEAQNMIQGAPLAVTVDTDGDGIPDDIEKRIGTDPGKKDTDGDGYDDENEIRNGYDPLGPGKKVTELSPIEKILIDNLELEHPLAEGNVSEKFSVDKIVNADELDDSSAADGAYIITGKAEPNSVATIYIYSDIPVVTTVSTDQFGNWRYEFDQPLTDGDHEIYVAINDNTGKVVNKSNPLGFMVKQAKAVSPSDITGLGGLTDTPPSKTNSTMMLYMMMFAVIVIAAGLLIFLFVIMQKNKTQQ